MCVITDCTVFWIKYHKFSPLHGIWSALNWYWISKQIRLECVKYTTIYLHNLSYMFRQNVCHPQRNHDDTKKCTYEVKTTSGINICNSRYRISI